MSDRMKRRLEELKAERAAGVAQLAAIEERAASLRQTMLRIEGAIQVLEEIVAAGVAPGTDD